MSTHPIEALLRPPVELWSTLVAFSTATIAILAPWALMMPPGIAYAAGAILSLIGLIRGRQAWRVLRYQRNMRRLPTYRLRKRVFWSTFRQSMGSFFREESDEYPVPKSSMAMRTPRSLRCRKLSRLSCSV